MRLFAFLLIAALQPGLAVAHATSDAMRTLEAYSAALNRYDCPVMLSLVSPQVSRRVAASPDGVAGFCGFVNYLQTAGGKEFLRAPAASLSSGKYRMVVVPNIRMAYPAEVGSPTLYQGTYVVHSSDGGSTWHVLDLACLSTKWVKAVYPPYAGKPRLVPASQQTLVLRNAL